MIRLLGFIVGSAVSIGVFLLILGIPDINFREQVISDPQFETVSQKTKDLMQDLEVIAEEIKEKVTEEVADEETVLPEGDSMTTDVEEPHIVDLPAEPLPMPTGATPDALKWHAFWNPFRSRIAAEGFVKQLEKVTGLDYRVVKIRTGVYEVTFAYEDDNERRDKMSLIASATGLDLPDS